MPKVGVVLSGCGVMDGSEIHEAVCVLLALSQARVDYQCMAPDATQMHVVNHLSNEPAKGESRNVLTESARIARGEITALGEVDVAGYDAFIFPGGFGAAKNLCTFAIDGPDCTVHPHVARLIEEAHNARKVLAFICIAPVIAAKVLGKSTAAKLTIGDDPETAAAITSMGCEHVVCPVDEAIVDEANRVVSSPAYMKATSVAEVYESVKSTVDAMLTLAAAPAAYA
ncbi:isoprenoid biosynthesis glyoxalase ElbB [bacterium]|nr:isoprenoid biosynthesis glyoxalase ElbB [bacterium]